MIKKIFSFFQRDKKNIDANVNITNIDLENQKSKGDVPQEHQPILPFSNKKKDFCKCSSFI